MNRRLPRGLVVPLALTALSLGAAPALAAPVVFDTSFGDGGYAFSTFGGPETVAREPLTTEGPGGRLISAVAVHEAGKRPLRGGEAPRTGVTVTQHDAQGKLLDSDTFAELSRYIDIYDVRQLADGRIIVVGAYDDSEVWFRIIGGDGTPLGGDRIGPPKGCYYPNDAVVHPSGQLVIAWGCEMADPIEVVTPEPAAAENRRAARGDGNGPELEVDRFVEDLALDPKGRVLMLATTSVGEVGRITILDGGHALDESFGAGDASPGWATVDREHEQLAADDRSRPIVGHFYEEDEYERGTKTADTFQIERLTESGGPDTSFDGDGRVEYADERLDGLSGIGTDRANRVLLGTWLSGGAFRGRAIVRLTEAGAPDADFGANGVFEFDQDERSVRDQGAPLGVTGGTVGTYSFASEDPVPVRAATPIEAPEGRATLALVRIADPAPPKQEQPQQQPPAQPTTATAPSVSPPRQLRTCLSRRSFTIRVRPKNRRLASASVTVAGKKVKVTRKDGRLTATVDLRKLQQATFSVAVVAKGADGRTYRERRRYRTCRVGENGPKVKGGSTVITVGR